MSRVPNFPPTNSSPASTYHQFPYCVDLFVHAHAGSKPPASLAAAPSSRIALKNKALRLRTGLRRGTLSHQPHLPYRIDSTQAAGYGIRA